MKTTLRLSFILSSMLLMAANGSGQVMLLDDTWMDGDRTDTALPDESAWFASSVANTPTLSAAPGLLTGDVRMFETNTSSRLWLTHFTPAGAPVELVDGETFKVSLDFRALGVTTSNATSRGLRVGMFNFSENGAARVTGDGFSTGSGGGAPGTNVTGYLLNQNFGQRITVNNPIQLMKRTDTANVNLMGASGVFTALSSGGGPPDAPGFRNGVSYLLEFSVKRTGNSAEITCRFSDNDGWSIQHTAVDPGANFRFDGLAFRPNSVPDTADTFQFSRCRVETIPFQLHVLEFKYPTLIGARVIWSALPGKSYQVEWRPSFDAGQSWTVLTTIIASGTIEFFEDPDAFLSTEGYYRVVQVP
jgi:hypothetical protein